MNRSREQVLEILQQNRATMHRFGVHRLGLFGSCARGEARPTSDLDFVVELETKSFDAYMGLKVFLEELFGCPVDLILQDRIKPQLRKHILDELIDVPGL